MLVLKLVVASDGEHGIKKLSDFMKMETFGDLADLKWLVSHCETSHFRLSRSHCHIMVDHCFDINKHNYYKH